MGKVISLVLGGGRGTRLYPLTKYRAKPAVPLAGKFRLIDIPLSNCINSRINRIYVLTQFLSVSLHRHIRQTYRFDAFDGGFVELLAAQQTMDEGTAWYQGTADAVRKNVRYLQHSEAKYVLILSGDQLYRMNFEEMIETHEKSHADVTIAAKPVSSQEASGLGIMKANTAGQVIDFVEKPKTEADLNRVRTDPAWFDSQVIKSRGRDCLASMGIYLFNRQLLVDLLTQTNYQDFGKEVFPQSISSRHVQVHLFDGYWEDIGTIKAFYDANLALVGEKPEFELRSAEAPVYTRPRFLPPSRIDGASIKQSLIADGCRIGKNCVIENSIIGLRCHIGEGATIRNSIVMGADMYQRTDEMEDDRRAGRPVIGIGAESVIEGAIIDKNTRIGSRVQFVNESGVQDSPDHDTCMIRDGIPLVLKDAIIPDGWVLK